MLPVGIFFAHGEKLSVEIGKTKKARYRDKKITPMVTDFVLDITFFLGFPGICVYSLETVVFLKTGK